MFRSGKVFLAALLFSALSFSSAVVFAEDGPCKADIAKFCKDMKPGGGAIIRCLKEHEAELSESCKAHGSNMKEHGKEVREACHADAEKLCADEKGPRGKMKCMRAKKDQLSEACQKEIGEMKEMRKKAKK